MFDNLTEIISSILIFLIVLFLYLHIQYQFKTSSELEIYEIEHEITKNKLEEICDLRQPIILDCTEEMFDVINETNKKNICDKFSTYEIKLRNKNAIGTEEDSYINLPVNIVDKLFNCKDDINIYYTENNSEFINEVGLSKVIKWADVILRPSSLFSSSYDIMFGSKNAETPLKYEINYRNYIISTRGKIYIKLVPPKYINNLNMVNDYENIEFRSDLNIWNPQEKYKLLMKQIKYLDVVLDIGKIIYIPPYWLYSIKFFDPDSSLCFLKYKTIMNQVVTTPITIMNILQSQNIKRKYFAKKTTIDITEYVKSLEKTEVAVNPEKTETPEKNGS